MKFHSQNFLLGVLCCTLFLSCSKDESRTSKTNPTKGIVHVSLTDSRGDYKAVYVDIEKVEVLWSDGTKGGWSQLTDFNPEMYELLTLSNGNDVLLGNLALDESLISQLRLSLGLRNFVVFKDNDSVAMSTIPGADQAGLTMTVNDSVRKGDSLILVIDFDAAKSVVQVGVPRKYKIKPELRILDEGISGSIKGIVNSTETSISIIAAKGIDSIGTYTNENGEFLIRGLESGTYDLYIDPGALSSFSDTLLSGNSVTKNFTLDVGTIKLK